MDCLSPINNSHVVLLAKVHDVSQKKSVSVEGQRSWMISDKCMDLCNFGSCFGSPFDNTLGSALLGSSCNERLINRSSPFHLSHLFLSTPTSSQGILLIPVPVHGSSSSFLLLVVDSSDHFTGPRVGLSLL